MVRLKTKQKLQVLVVMLFASIIGYASVEGPEPGHTNAPNDLGNCTACHDTSLVDTGPGNVRINGLPAVYEPGQTYTFSVTTAQNGRIRFGFQLTAIDSLGKRAGTLATVDSSITKVLSETGVGGRQYIEHTSPGTLAAIAGSRTWQLRWTAPATDIGTVRFYVAGNAANNNGENGGDQIYTSSTLVDSPTTLVTLSLETRPDGQTLEAGSLFAIDWTTTNPSNIDNTELRYSTDDGATFPITNQILFTTDPSVTAYDWTIPNTPSTNTRLRVKIGKKSGDAVEVVTAAFTIAGDGSGPPGPRIVGAETSGSKKLYVTGENFQEGARVYLDGEKQKTVNEEDFSHLLKCKKAGKKITPGVPVTLVVRNPDGSESPPFSFTKPVN